MVCRVSRGALRTSGLASAWRSSTVPSVAMPSSLTLEALNTGEHRKCVINMMAICTQGGEAGEQR